jgi:hypothetical protein
VPRLAKLIIFKDQESALIMASRRGFADTVSVICKSGGDVDQADKVLFCNSSIVLSYIHRMAYAPCRGH